jgi:hypothetical protein
MAGEENGRVRADLSFRRTLAAAVLLLAALVAVPAAVLLALAARGPDGEAIMATAAVVLLAVLGAWGVLWRLWLAARRHFAGLERLRGLLLGLEGRAEHCRPSDGTRMPASMRFWTRLPSRSS